MIYLVCAPAVVDGEVAEGPEPVREVAEGEGRRLVEDQPTAARACARVFACVRARVFACVRARARVPAARCLPAATECHTHAHTHTHLRDTQGALLGHRYAHTHSHTHT